jgi:hypothetical protein
MGRRKKEKERKREEKREEREREMEKRKKKGLKGDVGDYGGDDEMSKIDKLKNLPLANSLFSAPTGVNEEEIDL